VAPAGTFVIISVVEAELMIASMPLKLIVFELMSSLKLCPAIVTCPPTMAETGVKESIIGEGWGSFVLQLIKIRLNDSIVVIAVMSLSFEIFMYNIKGAKLLFCFRNRLSKKPIDHTGGGICVT
jgi:hypothetical protein